jgi:hypothetical protein
MGCNPYRLLDRWAQLRASMNGGKWGEVIVVKPGPDGAAAMRLAMYCHFNGPPPPLRWIKACPEDDVAAFAFAAKRHIDEARAGQNASQVDHLHKAPRSRRARSLADKRGYTPSRAVCVPGPHHRPRKCQGRPGGGPYVIDTSMMYLDCVSSGPALFGAALLRWRTELLQNFHDALEYSFFQTAGL